MMDENPYEAPQAQIEPRERPPAKKKRESRQETKESLKRKVDYLFWDSESGRPPLVIVIGTWLLGGVLSLVIAAGVVQFYVLCNTARVGDVLGIILVLFLAIVVLRYLARSIFRTTQMYYRCSDDEEGEFQESRFVTENREESVSE